MSLALSKALLREVGYIDGFDADLGLGLEVGFAVSARSGRRCGAKALEPF